MGDALSSGNHTPQSLKIPTYALVAGIVYSNRPYETAKAIIDSMFNGKSNPKADEKIDEIKRILRELKGVDSILDFYQILFGREVGPWYGLSYFGLPRVVCEDGKVKEEVSAKELDLARKSRLHLEEAVQATYNVISEHSARK